MAAYEAVIGLEIHVQLNSPTKMFCDCPNAPGERPNTNVCPICLWLPGSVPQFGSDSLERAVLTCLALNAEIQSRSRFDQKVYYYPDLPKGFQLSQFHKPLARNGWIEILAEGGNPKRIGIHEIHMEEDVAKLVHETEGQTRISLVDFNRAGTPLVEIVTEPDMRNAWEAMEFLRALRSQIRYVGTAECSMESGTMRADANISLRPAGTDQLNTKVEVKNMNSIRAVGNAIDHEIARQTAILNAGKAVVLHTRLWDPVKNVTTPMRGKFSGPCVPDPSVPEIVLSEEWLLGMRERIPEMPARKRARFAEQYGLSPEETRTMSAQREVAAYFEAVVANHLPPKTVAQWIASRLLPALRERNQEIAETTVTPDRFAELLSLFLNEEINQASALEVLGLLFQSEKSPRTIVEEQGSRQIGEHDALNALLDEVFASNPGAVDDLHSGKERAAGFLIGQAMRASGGKANPKALREILMARIKAM